MTTSRSSKNHRRGWRATCAFVCLLVAVCAGGGAGAARQADETKRRPTAATVEGRLAIFDDVWQTIDERYYDPDFHGVDWHELRATFRPLAASAHGQREFYAVLRRMLSNLRDPHTRVYAADERFDWRSPQFITVGLTVREIGGEMVVAGVENDSEAERARIRAGDIVTSIDGAPATAILAQRLREQAGATTSARVYAVAKLFDGPRDSFVYVTFRTADAREQTARLRRVLLTRPPALNVRRAGDYSVVRFNAFTPEIATAFVRKLRDDLQDVRGLVLDLRDNGGGEAESMADIASVFLPAGKSLGRFTDRAGRIHLEPQTRAAMFSAADEIKMFRGSVVVLTSARTASAAEVFVAALRDARRGVVVGEDTCGCVLGIKRRHTLPDGGLLDVSEVDYRASSGVRLEGVGIAPDERIAPTQRDLRTGRDGALERALKILKAATKD